MKALTPTLLILLVSVSCTVSREKAEARLQKNLAKQEQVSRAVEARQFIIKVDRIKPQGGMSVDLVPSSNFFIMNGEIASVSLAYLGRSYFSRQITGINFNGRSTKYIMKRDQEKGMYDIEMEVTKGADKFQFYIQVGSTGFCSISVNNANLQSVSYQGILEPVRKNPQVNKGAAKEM